MLEGIYEKIDIFAQAAADLNARCTVSVAGCVPSQEEHLLFGLSAGFRNRLIIAPSETKALEVLEACLVYDNESLYYPARDPMFYMADIRGSYISEKRSQAAKRLLAGIPVTVIACPETFTERIEAPDAVKGRIITLRSGGTADERALAELLTDIGYEHTPLVSGAGEFSVRGSIVDIFPYGAQEPYRLDLFGDTIESIKTFDVQSQRSIEEAEVLEIFPGGDDMGGNASVLDYFDKQSTLVCFIDPARTLEDYELPDLGGYAVLLLSAFSFGGEGFGTKKCYEVNARSVPSYNGRLSELTADLAKYKKNGWSVTLCCANEARAQRLRGELLNEGLSAEVICAAVRTGFEYPDIKEALISETDIFGQRRSRRKGKRRFSGDPLKSFSDLNAGDYVVHEQHGIGIYQGIERIKSGGTEKDYMKIQYAGGANLYVLATQFDRVQKYSGAESAKPRINRLGGREWTAAREKARAGAQDIAEQLVNLYAARQLKNGYAYGPDTPWQREFEDQFEYEATEDQIKATAEVKADMESTRIMDRLICGDVGFGKTEVAIRAAFKAVQEGKQVAFLAPTTILVKQHYETICRRMSGYPVEVRMLSRFIPAGEQKKIIAELKKGTADIVVGTHRLLSKDVGFKDLGLLIIDEEQRFGVTHKEKIKELRKDVDVLTLSATPIPRTLHMSLSGIRDMSLLTEPPVDRLPIQTYVMEYSDAAVKEAILREAARGGQVYYVYNRIDRIEEICARVGGLVPSLDVRFAHGRMSARELESIMADYVAGEFEVLVSTTIVESGLDISNVNTIIIHDADNFGLSQLYQLRGRVGRSNRTAYAFLMYGKDKILKRVSADRLRAIRDFSDLGSGIRIALKDLEIRGAGNLIGAEQSGHMNTVGYELYCRMLNEAVCRLKGEEVKEDFETSIELKVSAFIPSEYIADSGEKLDMYKKISLIQTQSDLDDIKEELTDRFGEPPVCVQNLLDAALLKSRAHEKYITEISGGEGSYKISMYKNAAIDTYKIYGFLNENRGMLKFVADENPYFTLNTPVRPGSFKEEKDILTAFIGSLDEIMEKTGQND